MAHGTTTHGSAIRAADDFDAIIALGSNMGDKRANIARAISLLTAAGDIAVATRSRDYKTPPWGIMEQDWFVNACVAIATTLGPLELLERCQDVERRMGRVRRERWGPRIVDVDVLVHRAGEVHEARLELPHPRITERAFVLAPLADIAPDLVIKGRPVNAWLRDVDASGVEPLAAS